MSGVDPYLDMADEEDPLLIPVVWPKGIYKVTLYGRGGSTLYVAHYPPNTSFQYLVPSHVGEMKVAGFQIEWEEW